MLNRLVYYCLLACLLLACTPADTITTAPAVTSQAPVSTARHTATADLPTITATPISTAPPTATASPVNTPTQRPPSTPRPTNTPPPTATSLFPDSLALPVWVSDPQASVLLATSLSKIYNDEAALSLLNASTGERFDFLFPEDRWYSKWRQTETGLAFVIYQSLTSGHNPDHYSLHQIDITTGQESQLPLSTIYTGVLLSPDGRFAADITGEPEAQNVIIMDRESGQEVMLNDPFNSRYPDDVDMSWSADSMLLAVQWFDFDEINYSPPATGLAIYTTDGSLYRYYTDVRNWGWAADGSYRLLTALGSIFENGEPCVLSLQTNTTDCLDEVTAWRDNGIEKTGYYQLLPDGSGLSFLYWDRATRSVGLCIIDLSTRDITCPVDETTLVSAVIGAEVGGMAYLVNYKWSPDGRYIMLEVDPFGPESDDRTLTQVTTVARDGSQFYIWGFGSGYNTEWRPLLNEEAESPDA